MIQALFALIIVLGLLGIFALLLKKYSQKFGVNSKNHSLKTDDILMLDQKNKIVTIKNQDKKYVIFIGANSQFLIDIYKELDQ